MFACSMMGEKKTALVIGKSAYPHCFRGVKLLVDYDSSKSAWMTEKIYANSGYKTGTKSSATTPTSCSWLTTAQLMQKMLGKG